MDLDSFDLIINLVAAGMGVAMVPQRSLALYRRRQAFVRLRLEDPQPSCVTPCRSRSA